MKIFKAICTAAIGFLGGIAAIYIINPGEATHEPSPTQTTPQVATLTQTVFNTNNDIVPISDSYQYVDLRSAAQKTVESVVHIKTQSRGKNSRPCARIFRICRFDYATILRRFT